MESNDPDLYSMARWIDKQQEEKFYARSENSIANSHKQVMSVSEMAEYNRLKDEDLSAASRREFGPGFDGGESTQQKRTKRVSNLSTQDMASSL